MLAFKDDKTLNNRPEQSRRIIIADGYPLCREALKERLRSCHKALDIAEIDTYFKLKQLLTADPCWDLLLLDLELPGMTSYSGFVGLNTKYLNLGVVLLSGSVSAITVSRSKACGTLGLIPKTASMTVISKALGLFLQGQGWWPEKHGEQEAIADQKVIDISKSLERLTPKQVRVMEMVAEGLMNKQIAQKLHVSVYTVKAHMTNILRTFNLRTRTQLAVNLQRLR